jgi:phosphoserine phosphatase
MKNKIKLVCFDLNKTLIKENTWLNLNLDMGVTKEEDNMILRLYEEGILSYEEGLSILERIYKKRGKATKENIQKSINKYSYTKGAKGIVKYLKENGYIVALITGSMILLAEKVAKELNIDHFEANNNIVFGTNNYLKNFAPIGEDSDVKLKQLENLCKKLNVEINSCACVGDGDNDALMFDRTKHGITFKGSKIEDKAWKVINSLGDLKNIL